MRADIRARDARALRRDLRMRQDIDVEDGAQSGLTTSTARRTSRAHVRLSAVTWRADARSLCDASNDDALRGSRS